jgi:lysophospholipase
MTMLREPATDRRAIPADARESTWIAIDDHQIRRIDWSGEGDGAPRGSILFFPGRGDCYEKYLETLEEWHRAGWRVTASDWRGQAGSGRLGKDPLTGHIENFSIWVDDLAYLWRRWVAETPGPHVLAAHSMGGHLVLRALVEKRVKPDAVVLSAPMTGIAGPPLPLVLLHAAARLMCTTGDPTRPAWKWSEKPGETPATRAALLTHDRDRYADEQWWRDHRPELAMGPGSWRWVERAYASWRKLVAPGKLESVTVPVLIVSTSADRLVSHPANLAAARRLPKAELMALGEEAAHEVLREVDAVRSPIMARIADFLDRTAPPR